MEADRATETTSRISVSTAVKAKIIGALHGLNIRQVIEEAVDELWDRRKHEIKDVDKIQTARSHKRG